MTCRADNANGWSYRFCPDDPPPLADRTRAVVQWLAVDEITNRGPDIDYAISTTARGLVARVSRDGIMGLIGNPGRLYPGLGTTSVSLACTLTSPGYLPRRLQATLGPIAGFPAAFAPADLGTVLLHRTPIVIRGRIVALGALDPTPQPNVKLSLAGVWSTFPPANVVPDTVIEPPNLLSLQPGLYADRVSGVDGLRRRDLTLTVGQDKTLLQPAVIGATTVRVSDQLGVTVGGVIAIDPGHAARTEYLTVTQIVGLSTLDQPATLTLAHPLALAHEPGVTCVVATPGVPQTNNPLSRDGIAGDAVAFAALNGVADGVVIEIGGGGAPVEYQVARLYSTTSDSDGYYRLPPISRVAMVKLHADQAPAQEPVMTPDYQRYENLVDVVYP